MPQGKPPITGTRLLLRRLASQSYHCAADDKEQDYQRA